jgi:hypothetical protein
VLKAASSQAAHLVADVVIGLAVLLVLAGSVLAWRLAQGPIDITSLVRREAPRLTGPGTTLSVGRAELAWEGFYAANAPLDIRWRDIVITPAASPVPISLPRGGVTLSVSRLLLGRIVPRSVEVDDAVIEVRRDAKGAIELDVDRPAAPAGEAAGQAPHGQGDAVSLLRELASPPSLHGPLPFLAQLRHVDIRNATVMMRNPAGPLWQAQSVSVVLQRVPGGGVTGTASLNLDLRGASSKIDLHADLSGSGTKIVATATPVTPSALVASMPLVAGILAPLAGVDMPLGVRIEASLDPSLVLTRVKATLQADAGTVRIGKGRVSVQRASAVLEAAGDHAELQSLRIALQAPAGAHGPPPVITAHANADRAAGKWRATVTVDIDQASFTDLAAYWPLGVGGGARPWLIENITTGLAKDARLTAAVEAPEDLSGIALTSLTGGLSAKDLTVYWLRPVPPVEHGSARLVFDSPDVLHIDILGGNQGKLRIAGGRMVINGLMAKDQFGDITAQINGPLADILTLLNHPRLKLLSRRPVTMQNPAGTAAVNLSVKLPLDARITMDDIAIKATAKLAGVHLGGIAAGRDLDDGTLNLRVDSDSLSVKGDATFAGIPAALDVGMDFRVGPPSQVLLDVKAHGTATAAELVTAGLWGGIVTGGNTGVDVQYSSQRNGRGSVAMSADLSQAVVTTPLGWNKQAGPSAAASARLLLFDDKVVGIDQIKANGPDLLIASHADMQGGAPRVLHLDAVKIGRTSARGTITFPRRPKDRLAVMLRGQTLDLSSYFQKRDAGTESDDDDSPAKPWSADIGFDRAILAKDESLAPVSVRAESDGTRITRGNVSAGPRGQVSGAIVPVPGGRKLTVNATDSGAVLLASGVADNVRGGTLKLDGLYADTQPHSPLSGTATLTQFRITDAPMIGLLLKAMTLYGAVDLLRGPGLGFQQATVPFRWQQRVLHMDNARAFSASLGLTAQGDIDTRNKRANLTGTVVPAYFFNQLPGRIPIIGRIFSPEKGGGLFAARYSVTGPLANPKVSVNPLSALTPGFLRGLFGLF